jgi:cellulose synthase/poly-beta-1,6-N-acetylglucosamine synthase-like glycosyltransferase
MDNIEHINYTDKPEKMLTCSIGVTVYNEQANIGQLLEALLTQELYSFTINEIIVLASGCTDNTEDVVKEFAKRNNRIRLLVQKKRLGKASAINYFLQNTIADIYVIESGDTLPRKDTIENLLRPFFVTEIGMTGGHSLPKDDSARFLGFTIHLLWQLHHKLALRYPKLGELVAFRKAAITDVPVNTAVDEAAIEALVVQNGYRLCYVPGAIIYNRGPRTIKAYLIQRRRIYAGHLHLKKTFGYAVSSMNNLRIFRLLISNIEFSAKFLLWAVGAVALESYARLLGLYDFYIRKRNPYIWDVEKEKSSV